MTAIERIATGKVIAILRGDFRGREGEIASALCDAGIIAAEVTLNSPGAVEAIRRLAASFGSHMAIGAGTVLKPDDVARVADAGAQFMVSPHCDCAVIRTAKRRGLASFPGCFTPSEVVEAFEAGADAAKLFPAQCLGPAFVKALHGPFPGVRVIPTGGVTPEMAREYFKAGAWAVAAGSELLGKPFEGEHWAKTLRERAGAYVAAARLGT